MKKYTAIVLAELCDVFYSYNFQSRDTKIN